jgi:hypothetical protein
MMKGIQNDESEAEAISNAAKHTKQLRRTYKKMEDEAVIEEEEEEETTDHELGKEEMEDKQKALQKTLHMHDKTMRKFIMSIVKPAVSSVAKNALYDPETSHIMGKGVLENEPSSNAQMIHLKMKYNRMNTAFEDLSALWEIETLGKTRCSYTDLTLGKC